MRSELRHSAVLVAGTVVTAGLTLAYQILAGRTLGRIEYAQFGAAIAFMNLGCMAVGPINGTVTKFVAGYAGRGEVGKIRGLYDVLSRQVGRFGLVILVIGLIGVKPLASVLQLDSVWPLLAAYAVIGLTLYANVVRGVLRGVQYFGHYSLNLVLESAWRLGVGALLFLLFHDAGVGVVAYVAALGLALPVARFHLIPVWRGHEPEKVDAAAIRRFAVPMFVLAACVAGFENLDYLFIKHYFTDGESGAYYAATTLSRGMGVFAAPFNVLLLPLIGSMVEQSGRIVRTLFRVCAYFLLLVAAPVVVFGLWPKFVIGGLYGDAFTAGAEVLPRLTIARLLGYLGVMICLFFASIDRFGFLRVYIPGLAGQVAALVFWHDSMLTVATVIMVVQAVMVTTLLALVARSFHQR